MLDDQLFAKPKGSVNLLLLAFLLVLFSGLVGGVVNLINGLVSEEYFRNIMGWEFEGIWLAAVFLGATQGLIYGLVFSVVYATGFSGITKGLAHWRFVFKQVLNMGLILLLVWLLIGFGAVAWATLFPELYRRTIIQVPDQFFPMLRYAWVGGSIWGITIGGLISLIYGLRSTKREWQRMVATKMVGAK